MIDCFLIFFLLLLSFYFSGTETAMTAVSMPQLYELGKKGNWRAQHILLLKKDSAKLLGTLLFGNNIVNIALTALSTALMIEFFGEEYGVLIATFGVSVVVLLFSEIMPKTYALNNPLAFSMFSVPLLTFFVFCFSPIVKAFGVFSQILIKFLPKGEQQVDAETVKAEIRGTILMPSEDDGIISQEKVMLKSVLDLSDVTVEDIMVHRSHVVSLNAALPLTEIFEFLSRSPYSRIPLWKGEPDNIIGVLHAKALLKLMNAYYRGKVKVSVADYLTKPWFVLNTTSLLDQLHAFKRRREHFALVVDEYGSLEGIITLEDIIEEIVGNIEDESDVKNNDDIKEMSEGAYIIDGQKTIRELNREFDWCIDDENAVTIAGYLLDMTQSIPEEGQKFIFDGFEFEIIKKTRNQLKLIKIHKIDNNKVCKHEKK